MNEGDWTIRDNRELRDIQKNNNAIAPVTSKRMSCFETTHVLQREHGSFLKNVESGKLEGTDTRNTQAQVMGSVDIRHHLYGNFH